METMDRRITNRAVIGSLLNLQKEIPVEQRFLKEPFDLDITDCFELKPDGNAVFIFKSENEAQAIYGLRDDLRLEGRKLYLYWLGEREKSTERLFLDCRPQGFKPEKWRKKENLNKLFANLKHSLPGIKTVKPVMAKNKKIFGANLEFENHAYAQYWYEHQGEIPNLPGRLETTGFRSPLRPKILNVEAEVKPRVDKTELDESGAEFDWSKL